MALISCVSTPGYTLIKAGSSCYNSDGQHPPFEFGNEAASPDSCASKCKERAQATGKTCTGFDTRSGCLFYYDEPVTQPKNDVLSGDCYSMDVPQGISEKTPPSHRNAKKQKPTSAIGTADSHICANS